MDLTITQMKVLKVLYENNKDYLTVKKISEKSKVNFYQVGQVLKRFLDNDYIYQPTLEGEVLISPDGERAYLINSNKTKF